MNHHEAEIKAIIIELRSILEDALKIIESTGKKDNETMAEQTVNLYDINSKAITFCENSKV
jgi:hypothetical protein